MKCKNCGRKLMQQLDGDSDYCINCQALELRGYARGKAEMKAHADRLAEVAQEAEDRLACAHHNCGECPSRTKTVPFGCIAGRLWDALRAYREATSCPKK